MKKSINYLLLFAALIVLGVGCQDEPNISEVRTLSLTASMPPDESISTRIAFTQVGKSVIPTWKNGDQLDLLFVQGSTKVKQTVMVSNISDDRKKLISQSICRKGYRKVRRSTFMVYMVAVDYPIQFPRWRSYPL